MNIDLALDVAKKAAYEVGAMLRKAFFSEEELRVEKKSTFDVVSELDVLAEEIVKGHISRNFPEDLFIGEESHFSEQQGSDSEKISIPSEGICWIVDPLDGTTNFCNAIPHIAVSIAAIENGERKLGLVYDPIREEMFTATVGSGACLNDKPIHCSVKSTLEDSVIAYGLSFESDAQWLKAVNIFEQAFKATRASRQFGAAALEQCWVACARLDGFFQFLLKPWDVAAGSLIIEEAGGRAGHFDKDSSQKDFSLVEESFVFSNAELYQTLLELCKNK